MGYYTRFESKVDFTDEQRDSIESISQYSAEIVVDGWDTVKWYNWVDDISKLSKLYPLKIFKWDCEGEESGDIWRIYAKNGKVETVRAKIVFDDFDESTLN